MHHRPIPRDVLVAGFHAPHEAIALVTRHPGDDPVDTLTGPNDLLELWCGPRSKMSLYATALNTRELECDTNYVEDFKVRHESVVIPLIGAKLLEDDEVVSMQFTWHVKRGPHLLQILGIRPGSARIVYVHSFAAVDPRCVRLNTTRKEADKAEMYDISD